MLKLKYSSELVFGTSVNIFSDFLVLHLAESLLIFSKFGGTCVFGSLINFVFTASSLQNQDRTDSHTTAQVGLFILKYC